MKRLFVDTSAWYAFVNASDPDHRPVARLLASPRGRLVTSSYVFDEVVTLCRVRLSHPAAVRVGRVLLEARGLDLVRVSPEDEREAWRLFQARADQRYSFTDCTSFSLMRRLGVETAVALDDDFRHEGFETLP